MAEVTRKRTGELLRVVFQILLEHPDGIQAGVVLQEMKSRVTLTPYESGEYESGGGQRVDKIVRFGTVDCVKAGWLTKNKGIWQITPEGKQAFNTLVDPEAFAKRALQLYNEWRAANPNGSTGGDEAVVEHEVRITYEKAEEDAWREIQEYLTKISPYELQEIVASLLRAMGYFVNWVSPPGKDGGVDILASRDPLGTRPPRIKVQVKRFATSVNVDGLRSFMALLGDEDVGIFVSTGGFTKDAAEEARTQEKRRITLIDLDRFFDLWVENYKGLNEESRRKFPLVPIYFLAPQP